MFSRAAGLNAVILVLVLLPLLVPLLLARTLIPALTHILPEQATKELNMSACPRWMLLG